MARTLRRGLLVLLGVLALLAMLTNAGGVYSVSRDKRPGESSSKRPPDFGEMSVKQPPVPGKSSVKQSPDSGETLNQQFPESVVHESPIELVPDPSGSNPTEGQSPYLTTEPPKQLPPGLTINPHSEQALDSIDESSLKHYVSDAKCAATPAEPPPCGGFEGPRQSPINIDPCGDHLTVDRRPLKFKNLDSFPESMQLTNTGNRVMGVVTWANTAPATISGGRLPGTFVFEIFDMHWGANSSYGSEHTINGHRYAAELHIGLRNIKYETIYEAVLNVDGTASITVLLDEKASRSGRGLAPLAESISQIKEAYSTSLVVSPPSLKQFLPHNLDRYVQYSGSPTALAPCLGTVSWIVLLEPVKILDIELGLLRDLRDKNGDRLCESTIRPLQNISGRKLYTKQRSLRCLFRS